ncbi:hypothetical protein AZOA_35920 [Azoarcus sp. Aa7]|nr:hypothetical protein [Azoarcus sp. Aa7]
MDTQKLRLEQTSRMLASFEPLRGKKAPPGGWLQAIRTALGLTVRQQALRAGIAGPTLHKAEKAEAEERITVAQLRKLAAALDCELVYGLVPRQSLQETLEAQADRVAKAEVLGVTHTMSLEQQRPSDAFVAAQLADRREQLIAGNWSKLWR